MVRKRTAQSILDSDEENSTLRQSSSVSTSYCNGRLVDYCIQMLHNMSDYNLDDLTNTTSPIHLLNEMEISCEASQSSEIQQNITTIQYIDQGIEFIEQLDYNRLNEELDYD
ncbi:4434_t:CDS:2 [Dentiscutata erythropus]|uniref:4434_t:CDS:1 n=1 Tax=Dentiscutata erythropus TaxID=1348616 RepID=A0A9N9IAY5_9GLOM|nr:4434_t:CDS:2 [Dentiscutata erythropus]